VLNGKEGWIYADYVKESSSNGTLASRSSANGVVIGRSVYVRKGAGASYSIITSLKRNASVKVLGKSSNGWYQVVLSNGVQGWMAGQYLKVSGTVSTVSSSSTTSSRGSVSSSSRGDENRESLLASQVVDFAKQQLGKAYKYGAEGPNAFDCSGLTYYVYKHFGYSIPRDSEGQGFGS